MTRVEERLKTCIFWVLCAGWAYQTLQAESASQPLITPPTAKAETASQPEKPACIPPAPPPISITAKNAYQGMPFQPGENTKFLVSYMGVKAGFLDLAVGPAQKPQKVWLMNFSTTLKTGDWYSGLYQADDAGWALAHPFSFAAAQFSLKQDHRKLLGSDYYEKKDLVYSQALCQVTEVTVKNKKPSKTETFFWEPNAADILAAFFRLRTLNYPIGKEHSFLVYTSEKNWWIKAKAEDHVKVETPLGEFVAVRINLETFIGKELQQRGKMKVWIAFQHPQRPLVRIEAEVKVGRFIAEIIEFKRGMN
jgi:hypothetical protein